MGNTVQLNDDLPSEIRETKVWITLDNMIQLDQEVLRRKARGEDKINGVRFNLNRSTVLRELISAHLPPPA
jgi:hypothetical protein